MFLCVCCLACESFSRTVFTTKYSTCTYIFFSLIFVKKIFHPAGFFQTERRARSVWGTVIDSMLHQCVPVQVHTGVQWSHSRFHYHGLSAFCEWRSHEHYTHILQKENLQFRLSEGLTCKGRLFNYTCAAGGVFNHLVSEVYKELWEAASVSGYYAWRVSVYGRPALQNRMNDNNKRRRLHIFFFVFKMQKPLRTIVWIEVFVFVCRQLEKY